MFQYKKFVQHQIENIFHGDLFKHKQVIIKAIAN